MFYETDTANDYLISYGATQDFPLNQKVLKKFTSILQNC